MPLKNIIWDEAALYDLDLIFLYYQALSTTAAKKIQKEILKRSRQLAKYPLSGLADYDANTLGGIRYIIYLHWRIYYKLMGNDDVLIFKIFDMRQNPNRKLSDIKLT